MAETELPQKDNNQAPQNPGVTELFHYTEYFHNS